MKRERANGKYIKRSIAWFLLIVMGINCFGSHLQPGVAKVHATQSEEVANEEPRAEESVTEELAAEEDTDTMEEEAMESVTEDSAEEPTEEIIYEDMTVNSVTTLSKNMEVGNLTINQDLHLNGYNLTVYGDVYVNGTLYIESGTLVVTGDYKETNNARICMKSHNDNIEIHGDYVYANGYVQSQQREKGVFEIKGDVLGADGSYCDSACVFGSNVKVILSGDEAQTIDISTDSKMQIAHLVIQNTSEEGVLSKHMLMTEQITDENNKLHFMCEGNKGFVLTEDMEVEGDFCLTHGTLDLAGYTMTVKGNFSHAGGTIVMNGGSLIIDGDYAQQLMYQENEIVIADYSSGILHMSEDEDYLLIHGDWICGGIRSTKESLHAGTIELKGSLYVLGGMTPVLPETSKNHVLQLTGDGLQTMEIGENYQGDFLRFANLIISQPESGSVQWTNPIAITGSVSHESSNISGDMRLEGGVIRSSHIYGNVEVVSGTPFVSDVVIHGAVTTDTDLQGAGNVLQVEQDLIVNANCKVTNLTLNIKGDVTGNGSSLSCGEDVTVCLIGTSTQNLSVSHANSLFTNVVVDNPAGVVVQDNITVMHVTCNQGVLSYASGGVHGFALEEDMVYEGDLMIKGGSLELNGHKLQVTGNLTIAGGVLEMTNAKDYLLVDGNFVTTSNTSHIGKLTDGVLEVKGDFKQSGAVNSFAASGNHTTIFSGDEKQNVTFSDIYNSYLSNVEFRNTAGVTTDGTLPVNKTITQQGPFQGMLGIGPNTVFSNNQFQGDVCVLDDLSLHSDLEIDGNLIMYSNKKLYMEGNTLVVLHEVELYNDAKIYVEKGHLYCDSLYGSYGGNVVMQYAQDKMTVINDVSFRTNYSMSNGYIQVGGDITFESSSYVPMGADIILELNGTKKQTITMNATDHTFGKLVLNNTSEEGIYVVKDLKYYSIDNTANNKVTFANGGILGYTLTKDETIEGELTLSGGVLDLNGYNLTITGDFHHKGGALSLKNGTLTIQGNYNQSCGISTDAGTLRVEGNWNVTGNITGSSTVFQIQKNLVQTAPSYISFSNGCTLHLIGTEKQLLTSRWGNIDITHLLLDNPAGMEFTGVDYTYIDGTIRTNGYPVKGQIMSYATILDDTLCANVHFCGESNLDHDMYIKGNVELGGLKLNGYHLTVDGNCTPNNVGSYDTLEQTDGVLEVKGNLYYGSNVRYRGTGTNQVILSGDTKQTIAANNSEWVFKTLVIENTSDEGVYSEELLNVETIVDENGKLSFPYDGIMGYTLTKDTVIQGDLNLLGGTMDLNGYTLTVMGNLTHRNGTLHISGGSLQVEGDYILGNPNTSNQYQKSRSILSMKDGKDAVLIKGNFVFAPYVSHNTYLKQGVIELKGNVQCPYVGISHSFGKEFNLLFSGDAKQRMEIAKKYASNFRWGTLIFENTSAEGVEVVGGLYVANSVNGGEQLRGASGSHLYWNNGEGLSVEQTEGDLTIYSETRLNADLRVGGTLTVSNAVDVNNKHLTVNYLQLYHTLDINGGIVQVQNDLTCGTNSSHDPNITMEDASDVLQVTGNFTAKKGQLNLIDGNLEIKGNVDMGGITVTTGDNHTTTFSGKITTKGTTYIQEITVAEGICFQNLTLTKPRDYYVFNREVEVMCKVLTEEILDIIPPSTPTGLSATNVGYTKATISWQDATDDYGVSGYDLYRNDKKIMSLSKTTYVDKNLTPGTTYTYYVIAKDAITNTSKASDVITVSTLEDKEAPEIPDSIELVERMATALRLSFREPADNVKTVGYRIYRNGEEIGTTSRREYLDTGLAVNSPYSYQITAYDAEGNESELSEAADFYTQGVTIKEMSPANYGELSGTQAPLQLVFQNAGSSAGYQVYMGYREKGQEEFTTLVSKTVGEHTAYRKEIVVNGELDTSLLSEEEVEVLVRITDAGGYVVEESYTYYVDKTAPSVMEEVGAEVKDGVAVISYAKGKEVDIAGYYIYRQEEGKEEELLTDIKEAGKTYYYDKTIEEGKTYTYYVAAYDIDGHIGEKSEGFTVTGTADESAPVITGVEPIEGTIYGKTSISIHARDNKELGKASIEVYNEIGDDYEPLWEGTFHNGIATYELDTTAYTDEVTLRITVTDTSDNENEEEYAKTYPVDNVGPKQIKQFTAEVIATNIVLRWDASEEDDFSYFLLEEEIDGVWQELVRTTTVTGYAVEGLTPHSTHIYRVTGVDTRGNVGEASEPLTVEVLEDTVVPHVTRIIPNGGYFNNVIPLVVTVHDNTELAKVIVESSVDQKTWSSVTTVDLSEPSKDYTLQYDYPLETIEEGDLYIRAYGVDASGNEGDVNQFVVQYVIDKTAPSTVENLVAGSDTGSIHLTWNEPVENDIACYEIYRSLEELNRYTCIANGVTSMDYYDRSAAYDTAYSYKIRAMDYAGNVSDYSNVTVAQRMPDDEAPGVYSLVPEKESYISGNCEISAYVADNDRIASGLR